MTGAGSSGAIIDCTYLQLLPDFCGSQTCTSEAVLNELNLGMQLDEVNQAAAEGKEPAFGVHLDIASYGDMSSFFWAHSQPPPAGLVECDVAYGELPRSW